MADSSERYEEEEVAISVHRFPREGEVFQVVAKSDAAKRSGNGYLSLTVTGAKQCYTALGEALRKRGVVP